MALEKLLVGQFYVYVAPSGTARPADLNPGGSANWQLLGSGWNRGGDGIRHNIGRTFQDVRIENEVEPIDSFLSEVNQTLEVMLLDWSAEAVAWAVHGGQMKQTDTAAATGVPGSRDIDLEMASDVEKLAVMIQGQSPYNIQAGMTGPYRSNLYWPLCRPEGDWESTFMLATAAPNPFRVRKLKHATLNGGYFLQNADPT